MTAAYRYASSALFDKEVSVSKAPALVSVELDRRDAVYRFGDALTARVAMTAQRALRAAELKVGLGYALEREGPLDRLVHEVTLEVPALSPGEAFETSVPFVLPAGLPSYSGVSFELTWGVVARFDGSLWQGDARHRADLTLLPGTAEAAAAQQQPGSELVPIVSDQGQVRYRRTLSATHEALLRYGPTLGALGFGIAGLGMLGTLTGEVIGMLSGPEQVLVGGEWVAVEPWQPNLHPVIRFAAQSFGLGVMALFAIIPCFFGFKLAKVAWREQLHAALVMRRLGELDLEPLAPAEVGAPWIGALKLCARQDLTLETLELKVVQEEVIVRTRTRRRNPSFKPRVLGEWSVNRRDQLHLKAGRLVSLPLEVTVPNTLPGSWQVVAQRGTYEVHHRWVLQAWIQPAGQAPVLKSWVLERRPSSAYEPQLRTPSQGG